MKKLSYPEADIGKLKEMTIKEIRALEKRLLKEEKEEEEGHLAETAHLPVPVKEAEAPKRRRKLIRKKPVVSTEEAKVLDQTTSAFLPAAIAESTRELVVAAPRTLSNLPKAEVAVASVGIQSDKKGRPKKAKDVEKEKVAKEVKRAEAEIKVLEAEKKGLLKSKEAKQKARDIRFALASSEEGAEMNVKEGAMKTKALLGKVKGEVVEKVKARREKAHKVAEEKVHGEKKPRKAALRTHKMPVEAVVPPALGKPHVPAVPKQHSHSLAAAVKQLGRVGISV